MSTEYCEAADCYLLGPFSAYSYLKAPEPHLRFHAWQCMLSSLAAGLFLALYFGTRFFVVGAMEEAGLNNWDLHPWIFLFRLCEGMIAIFVIPVLLFLGWLKLRDLARRGGMVPAPIVGRMAARKAGVVLL